MSRWKVRGTGRERRSWLKAWAGSAAQRRTQRQAERRESSSEAVIPGCPSRGGELGPFFLELRGQERVRTRRMGWAVPRALVYLPLEQPRRHGGSETSLTSVPFLTAPFESDFPNYYAW